MSEHASHHPEHIPKHHEQLVPKSHETELARQRHEKAQGHETHHERVEKARHQLAEVAPMSKEIAAQLAEEDQHDVNEVRWWSSELKLQTLNGILATVRSRLSRPERSFSKVIHQRTIEKVSDIAGNTIARPSGILVGSICAFIGSLVSYLLAKRLGGELSSSVTLFFFLGGFVIGIFGEMTIWFIRKSRAKS